MWAILPSRMSSGIMSSNQLRKTISIWRISKYASDQEYEFNFVRGVGDVGNLWVCEDCAGMDFIDGGILPSGLIDRSVQL